MSILKHAGVSAVSVAPSTSVMGALALMKEKDVDTLFVVEKGVLRGAFTQRDVSLRVVLDRLDPETTAVGTVMTSPAIEIAASATVADALVAMAGHRISQVPIVDEVGTIIGMVTLRDIFREQTVDLTLELDSLIAYHSADGIGG
jgi:CBS domain-containing protein